MIYSPPKPHSSNYGPYITYDHIPPRNPILAIAATTLLLCLSLSLSLPLHPKTLTTGRVHMPGTEAPTVPETPDPKPYITYDPFLRVLAAGALGDLLLCEVLGHGDLTVQALGFGF